MVLTGRAVGPSIIYVERVMERKCRASSTGLVWGGCYVIFRFEQTQTKAMM